MIKSSSKPNARFLRNILKKHGCLDIVFAPGSRNAPLIQEFGNDNELNCISAPDERSAAFIAMGICIGNKRPAAVMCSSGSATVNFYPAVVEAFYQKLPLVVISADRPEQWIDQGIGQTIRQEGVFSNHIVKSVNLNREEQDELTLKYNQRLINEAMLASRKGPVHINVAFQEPLYEVEVVEHENIKFIDLVESSNALTADSLNSLVKEWDKAEKVLILVGQNDVDEDLDECLNMLNQRSPFLILSETVSNVNANYNIRSIDRLINTISDKEKENFIPDLLITIGGDVVSKMIKKLFQSTQRISHWHVSESSQVKDTFLSLTKIIPTKPLELFKSLETIVSPKPETYRDSWLHEDAQKSVWHKEYEKACEYSDFKVFGKLLNHLPDNSILHTANSTAVRYAQLFDHQSGVQHYSNRGTSGIDGCTSTAIGHALTTNKIVTLISGDVAFLYDSNGFWNNAIPANLRVIVINNQGGNIFRIIEGPSFDDTFEKFQETHHNINAKGIAETFGVAYRKAENISELESLLPDFYETSEHAQILEVFTPRIDSPLMLKKYFKFLLEN